LTLKCVNGERLGGVLIELLGRAHCEARPIAAAQSVVGLLLRHVLVARMAQVGKQVAREPVLFGGRNKDAKLAGVAVRVQV